MKDFKNFLLVGVLFMISLTNPIKSSSQIITKKSENGIANKLALKTTLTAPFEFYSGYNIGIEYAVLPIMSLQHSYSWLVPVFSNNNYGVEQYNLSGYRLRNEVRFYHPSLLGDENMYIAMEISFDKISFDKYRTFEFFDEEAKRTYYEYRKMKETRRGQSYNFKVGYIYRISQQIYIDAFAGVGIRNFYKITYDVPNNMVSVFKTTKRDNLEKEKIIPNVLMGISLGVRIK